jgi:hypothetical protein
MHLARVTGLGPRGIIAADRSWFGSSNSTTTIITTMVVGITTDSAAIAGKDFS